MFRQFFSRVGFSSFFESGNGSDSNPALNAKIARSPGKGKLSWLRKLRGLVWVLGLAAGLPGTPPVAIAADVEVNANGNQYRSGNGILGDGNRTGITLFGDTILQSPPPSSQSPVVPLADPQAKPDEGCVAERLFNNHGILVDDLRAAGWIGSVLTPQHVSDGEDRFSACEVIKVLGVCQNVSEGHRVTRAACLEYQRRYFQETRSDLDFLPDNIDGSATTADVDQTVVIEPDEPPSQLPCEEPLRTATCTQDVVQGDYDPVLAVVHGDVRVRTAPHKHAPQAREPSSLREIALVGGTTVYAFARFKGGRNWVYVEEPKSQVDGWVDARYLRGKGGCLMQIGSGVDTREFDGIEPCE